MDREMPPEDRYRFERDTEQVAEGFWPKLRRLARRMPFLRDLVAAYYCAMDPATPFEAKAVLMGALAYFVLPFDIIPDFLAGFGFADDAAVIYGAIRTVAKHIRPEHRQKAEVAISRLDD